MKIARIKELLNGKLSVDFGYNPAVAKKMISIPTSLWIQNTNTWLFNGQPEIKRRIIRLLFHAGYAIFPRAKIDLSNMLKEMQSQQFSHRTIRTYIHFNQEFAIFCSKDPHDVVYQDILDYTSFLTEVRHYHASSLNLAISALKFYYGRILQKSFVLEKKRPRKDRRLPKVLNHEEVVGILGSLPNLKHRLLLYLAYSGGLRVSEVVRLRLEGFDRQRQVIHIRRAKGRKDRYTLLSEKTYKVLREYLDAFQPVYWLFPGQGRVQPLSIRSAEKIFKNACREAGIEKDVSIHCLRHSFATHLLEGGTDIRYIQELLGHAHTKTTEIYTHVAKRDFLRMKSPLDGIETDEL